MLPAVLLSTLATLNFVQAQKLREELSEREGELAELGYGVGGLEKENSNLEAQVGAGGMFGAAPRRPACSGRRLLYCPALTCPPGSCPPAKLVPANLACWLSLSCRWTR